MDNDQLIAKHQTKTRERKQMSELITDIFAERYPESTEIALRMKPLDISDWFLFISMGLSTTVFSILYIAVGMGIFSTLLFLGLISLYIQGIYNTLFSPNGCSFKSFDYNGTNATLNGDSIYSVCHTSMVPPGMIENAIKAGYKRDAKLAVKQAKKEAADKKLREDKMKAILDYINLNN